MDHTDKCFGNAKKFAAHYLTIQLQKFGQLKLYLNQVICGNDPHLSFNHVLLDCPHDSSGDRRKQKSGFLPIEHQVVAFQQTAGVSGDGGDNHFFSAFHVSFGTEKQNRPTLDGGLIRDTKCTRTMSPRLKSVVSSILFVIP
jgi:hypothetical protein